MLTIGERVVYGRPNGRQFYGVITKVNPTTYRVRGDNGSDCRCSHDFVRPANSTGELRVVLAEPVAPTPLQAEIDALKIQLAQERENSAEQISQVKKWEKLYLREDKKCALGRELIRKTLWRSLPDEEYWDTADPTYETLNTGIEKLKKEIEVLTLKYSGIPHNIREIYKYYEDPDARIETSGSESDLSLSSESESE